MSLVLALLLQAAAKKAPPEPKVWMCRKGDLLWHETFAGTEWSKDWHKGQGDWKMEDGQLRGAEKPADNHHAYASRKITEKNVVIQFTFKLDGAGWLGGFFDGKEHVAALSLGADAFRIRRMSGIGPTSKSTEIDSSKIGLKDGNWHTVVWEIYGDEMVATVDDNAMVLARAEGLSMERQHLELNTAGGPSALFKDVKVWKAELDDKWPAKRAQLIPRLKKKPAALGYK
jgi:hypothetical protein